MIKLLHSNMKEVKEVYKNMEIGRLKLISVINDGEEFIKTIRSIEYIYKYNKIPIDFYIILDDNNEWKIIVNSYINNYRMNELIKLYKHYYFESDHKKIVNIKSFTDNGKNYLYRINIPNLYINDEYSIFKYNSTEKQIISKLIKTVILEYGAKTLNNYYFKTEDGDVYGFIIEECIIRVFKVDSINNNFDNKYTYSEIYSKIKNELENHNNGFISF